MKITDSKMTKRIMSITTLSRRIGRGVTLIRNTDQNLSPERVGQTVEDAIYGKQIGLNGLENTDGIMLVLNGGFEINNLYNFINDKIRVVSENVEINGFLFSELPIATQNHILDSELQISWFSSSADISIVKRVLNVSLGEDYLRAFASS